MATRSLQLDRFYLPPSPMRLLKDCEVLDPSLTGLRVSDHHATVITINVRGGHNVTRRNWRLSTALLVNPVVVKSIANYLNHILPTTTPTVEAWEQVKDQLRQRFTEWGKIKACKHTQTINSVAQKIRILTRAPIHTPLSLSDIELLRAQHQELLRTTSLVARVERFQSTSTGGPGALRHLQTHRNGCTTSQQNHLSAEIDDNTKNFTNYFKDMFGQGTPDAAFLSISSLLDNFPS
ncbi:unnamed protein product [Ixodes persulcatus]